MLQQVLVNVVYFAGAWWFGEHGYASARQQALTQLRTQQLQNEQAKVSRQAVTIERLRIARELHDAVAHHVSLMGVQAAAARAVLDSDAAEARTQLEGLEASARTAVSELYQLLGTLRDEDAPDEASASLGLADLPALIDDVNAAGLRITLERVGDAFPVPALVGLNLYRIAQESLTNVGKHAGAGTRGRVHLRYGDDTVELEIIDEGLGRPGPSQRGAGLGLVGMRERAASLGGHPACRSAYRLRLGGAGHGARRGTGARVTSVRIVLVDDHELMRRGIRTIVSAQPDLEVVGEAGSGEEALDVVRALAPDVVCMDVQMPGIGGLEATRQLVADPAVSARVLMLTTFEREEYLLAALQAGASGFLLKNARSEHLVDGIRAVAAGDALLSPEVTRAVIERAVTREREAEPERRMPRGTPPEQLTDRELEVLTLMARGLSNDEIAAALVVGRATVKTHVSNVLTKLALRDRVQAVAFAYRSGLVD